MKGGFILSRLNQGRTAEQSGQRRVVVVDGIGDPEICHSDTRVHDTKIFLLNNASNGVLRLSSSLVRITLENIEQTEEAVKGESFLLQY